MSDETVAQQAGSEAAAKPTATKKPPPDQTKVMMNDGREVIFVGKRNLNKDYKVEEDGAVTATFDFRNGEALKITIEHGDPILLALAGHGLVAKGGDEAAGLKDKDTGLPDVESMAMSVGDVLTRLGNRTLSVKDRWFAERAAGDGFSGAAVVVRAIAEAKGKTVEWVKAWLESKLVAGKEAGLTRQKLYLAFRAPGTKTAPIIERMEQEKAAGSGPKVDANALLDEED